MAVGSATTAPGKVTAGPTGNAPASASTRVVASHDPDAAFLTGFPGERISHTNTGGQGTDDPAAGVLTGFPGDRTPSHLGDRGRERGPGRGLPDRLPGRTNQPHDTGGQGTDDPAAGVLTGFPGHRTPSHLGAAAEAAASTDPSTADQRDEPGTNQPVTRTDTTN